jgi:peptidoglycan/xylan/chitin deacetylase (PgdA/CDA1 family)
VIRFHLLNFGALAGAGASVALAPERVRWPILGGIAVAWILCVTKGVWDPRSSLFCSVFSRGSDRTKIALTFDDGPGDATRQILGILRENQVLATFFVVGENVKGREDVVRSAANAGHTIGSHTFAHSRLTNFLLGKAMKEEISKGIDAVEKAIGKRPRLYRPPVGLKSPAVARAVRALDLSVIGWRVRGKDGGSGARESGGIVERLLKARGGDVLVLHDGVEPGRSGDRTATLAALREAIPLLKARGFSFTTVDQLLNVKAYA